MAGFGCIYHAQPMSRLRGLRNVDAIYQCPSNLAYAINILPRGTKRHQIMVSALLMTYHYQTDDGGQGVTGTRGRIN